MNDNQISIDCPCRTKFVQGISYKWLIQILLSACIQLFFEIYGGHREVKHLPETNTFCPLVKVILVSQAISSLSISQARSNLPKRVRKFTPNFVTGVDAAVNIFKYFNSTACFRHQCRKITVLSCHRCLINTGIENNYKLKIAHVTNSTVQSCFLEQLLQ